MLFVFIVLATVGIIVAIVNFNNDNSKQTQQVNWIKSGKYAVDNKKLKENEYVLIATGKDASYKVIENKIEFATDSINTRLYLTLKKGQTVDLKNAKMCKVSQAPLYKPKNGTY